MTNQQHPITPPPSLTDKWNNLPLSTQEIFVIVARWGADQELDACCEWMQEMQVAGSGDIEILRAARRPKPPSLKEQALAALKRQSNRSVPSLVATEDCDTIRRALEQLDD